MVLEKKLYDLLEVKPEASADEIRKSYLRLAKKWHPDKNQKNPNAEETFKNIVNAYQVLSNPQLRIIYDEKGLSGAQESEHMNNIDPSKEMIKIFRAIFGCGYFDEYFGDVETFPLLIKLINEVSKLTFPTNSIGTTEEIEREMQKNIEDELIEREKTIIDKLAHTLYHHAESCNASKETQNEQMAMLWEKILDLCSYPGGKELVKMIGSVYEQEAKQHLKRFFKIESIFSEIAEVKESLSLKFKIMSSAVNLKLISNDWVKEIDKGNQVKLANVDESTNSSLEREYQSSLERQQKLSVELLNQGLTTIWAIGKYLIIERLKKVCEKAMRMGKTKDLRTQHREKILKIGKMFLEASKKNVILKKNEFMDLPKFR